ncbi:uncharacterized protein [Nicotiana tomentosiformis]|uniref:uncharacterized protein n=1 Tax=Nicotiana tomentosiformis TaxID=4098 RepID=UPI00051B09BD|nr:BSD domain-containing protein 1-like isoform X1 [Nicotiana tomentosiformis]
MNFFKSILSDDPYPDPPIPKKPQESTPEQSHKTPDNDVDVDPDHTPDSGSDSAADGSDGGVWSFGGLFKTLSTRSESVLETYRKDLQEFGSGLKKETELFREVASRAVKDLPNSIEVIDGVIKSTAEIISQGKDSLLASSDDVEPETPDQNRVLNSARYSRFESQLINIQNDPNTFCLEPEDLEEYKKWKLGFDLKEKNEEVETLIGKIGSLEGIYKRVVLNEVDHETFWCRYFYRVYKLEQQESVRAKLVKRAISIDDDDEELSWDVDDDDDNEQESNAKSKVDEQRKEGSSVIESSVDDVKKLASAENESANKDSANVAKEVPPDKSEPSKEDSTNVVKQAAHSDESKTLSSATVGRKEENQSNADGAGKIHVVESSGNSEDSKKEDSEVTSLSKKEGNSEDSKKEDSEVTSLSKKEGNSEDSKKEDPEVTSLDKKEERAAIGAEGKGDKDESGKGGDVSIVSSHKTGADVEDLDWAEIEDIECNDDKKATSHAASSNRADLRKRLSVEEDDEDLSWDIEDDD